MKETPEEFLLNKTKSFPKHELSDEQRAKIIYSMQNKASIVRKGRISFQKIGAVMAMLLIIAITPILIHPFLQQDTIETPSNQTKAAPGQSFSLIDENGKAIFVNEIFGIPNKIGLFGPEQWVAKDYRGVAKIMVYVWGKEGIFSEKSMTVEGTHVESGKKQVLSTFSPGSRMYNEDAHAVTSFQPFEQPGTWNLKFLLGKEEFGEFSIYINKPFVEMGKTTLLISQDFLKKGLFKEVMIEVEGSNLPEEIPLEIINLKNNEKREFLFKDKRDYIRVGGTNISMYSGNIEFDTAGKYQLSVLNENTTVNVME